LLTLALRAKTAIFVAASACDIADRAQKNRVHTAPFCRHCIKIARLSRFSALKDCGRYNLRQMNGKEFAWQNTTTLHGITGAITPMIYPTKTPQSI
jgi:hypothetical protein